ncbi:protein E1 [Elephant endotheliotropic herpesvirus 3A]|uniref:Protein E1 n=1 Tax=Elephant endotheliotropic herpesvirus 3A TaxID=1329409 RepID=A0A866VR49_9BETA|nr:protein E1 [Elephant endotheliotropic herpesvirus 3A]QOE74356.1 protein E1 [Elephant endotheliotropic herpesvirus 3A]
MKAAVALAALVLSHLTGLTSPTTTTTGVSSTPTTSTTGSSSSRSSSTSSSSTASPSSLSSSTAASSTAPTTSPSTLSSPFSSSVPSSSSPSSTPNATATTSTEPHSTPTQIQTSSPNATNTSTTAPPPTTTTAGVTNSTTGNRTCALVHFSMTWSTLTIYHETADGDPPTRHESNASLSQTVLVVPSTPGAHMPRPLARFVVAMAAMGLFTAAVLSFVLVICSRRDPGGYRFPANSVHVQLLAFLGVVALMGATAHMADNPDRPAHEFAHLALIITYASLFVAVCNAHLIHNCAATLPSKILLFCTLFCVGTGAVLLIKFHETPRSLGNVRLPLIQESATMLNTSRELHKTVVAVNNEGVRRVFAEAITAVVRNLETTTHVYPYSLLTVTLIIAAWCLRKDEKYVRLLLLTLAPSWVWWTLHLCVYGTLTPNCHLTLALAYLALIMYLIPISVTKQAPRKVIFTQTKYPAGTFHHAYPVKALTMSGGSDTKKLLLPGYP